MNIRHGLQQPRRGPLPARQNLAGTLLRGTPQMQHASLGRRKALPSLPAQRSCSYRVAALLPPQLWQLAAPSRLALLQQLLLQRTYVLAPGLHAVLGARPAASRGAPASRRLRDWLLCALEREPLGKHCQMPPQATGEVAPR